MSKKIGPGWNGIVKVQQALRGDGTVLIYNETKSLMYEDQGAEDLLLDMGKRLKVFYHATITKDRTIMIYTDRPCSQNHTW